MNIPEIRSTPKITLHGPLISTGRLIILVRKADGGENDSFDWFEVVHRIGDETRTIYSDGLWSGCGPVPDDSIRAAELGITPARHRLEHDLWHHLVGIFIYRTLGSPIIWRDAHEIPQPPTERMLLASPDTFGDWSQAREEEWLVTALSHCYHGEHSRDHGASIWLANNGHDVEMMMQTVKQILDQIPSD